MFVSVAFGTCTAVLLHTQLWHPPIDFEIPQLTDIGAYLVLSNTSPDFCKFCISQFYCRRGGIMFETSSHFLLRICTFDYFL